MKTPTVLECKEYQEWPQCDYWIHVFKLEQLVRDKYLLYYDGFDDCILCIPGDSLVGAA